MSFLFSFEYQKKKKNKNLANGSDTLCLLLDRWISELSTQQVNKLIQTFGKNSLTKWHHLSFNDSDLLLIYSLCL